MRYLGIEPARPKIGVFDFTCCEGCELQLANQEQTLAPFLRAVEIVAFREISSAAGADYQVALVEGAISRSDEEERLRAIRERATTLVALGSCACFGGVNRLKNDFNLEQANRLVYGNTERPTRLVRPVKEIVAVDLELPGCPVAKPEVERVVQALALGLPIQLPDYPVCVECKQRYTVCVWELGQLCLGPITRAGCDAPCPAGGLGCWGCRGPAADANIESFYATAAEWGFAEAEVIERMQLFGGFAEVLR